MSTFRVLFQLPAETKKLRFFLPLFFSWIVFICGHLAAQQTSTFQMTIASIRSISALHAIPGAKQFYACSETVFPQAFAPVVLKLDTAGTIIWKKQYDIAGATRIVRSKTTSAGGLLLLCAPELPYNDTLYCLKIDSSGELSWCKQLRFTGINGFDIIEASDGSVLVSGSVIFEDYTRQSFLIKLDANGEKVWMKRFEGLSGEDVPGGGIIERNKVIIFCSSLTPEDYPGPQNIRLSRLSLADGSVLSVKDLFPSNTGLYDLKIYDDFQGGYYIRANSFIYRSPCQTAYTLRLDSNLNLISNFELPSAAIQQAFGVLNDGSTFHAGYTCMGYNPTMVSSTITKVSPSGDVLFSAHYPTVTGAGPYDVDTLITITSAISIGNQIFAAGSKNSNGFITALNNQHPGQNNCSLLNNAATTASQSFNTNAAAWSAIITENLFADSLDAAIQTPSLGKLLTGCYSPSVWYVDQHANGKNDGTSWKHAFTSLSAALDKVNKMAGSDTIMVAAGTYTPAPQTAFVFSKLHAVILGGYPTGGGTRNPMANPVILQGAIRYTQSAVFDGFTIK